MSECINTNHQDYQRLKSYLGGDEFNVDRLFAEYNAEVAARQRNGDPLRGDEHWPNYDFIMEWVDNNIHFGEDTDGTGRDFVMSYADRWKMNIDLAYNKTEGTLKVDSDYLKNVKPAYSENFQKRDKNRISEFTEISSDERAAILEEKATSLGKISKAFKSEYDENSKKGLQTVTQIVSGEAKEQKESGGESTFHTEAGTFTHNLLEEVHKVGKDATTEDRVKALMKHWDKERNKDDNPLYIEKDADAKRMCEQIVKAYETISDRYDIVSMESPVVLHSELTGEPILGRCDIIALDKHTGQGVLIDIKTHVDKEIPSEGNYNKFFQNYGLTPVGNGEHTAWDHANIQTMGYAAAFNKLENGAIERRGMIQMVIKGDAQTGHVSDFGLNTPIDTEVHNGVVEMYDSADAIQRASAAFKEMNSDVSEEVRRFEQSVHDLQKYVRGMSYHAMESLSQQETYKPPLRWLSGLNIDGDLAAVFKGTQLLAENFIKKLEGGLTSIEQLSSMWDEMKQISKTNNTIGEVSKDSKRPMILEYGMTVLGLQKGSQELEDFTRIVQEQQQWMDRNVTRCQKALDEAMKNHFYAYVAPDIKEALFNMGPLKRFMDEEYEKLWKEGKKMSKGKWVASSQSFRMQFKKEAYDRAMERYKQSSSTIDADINSMVDFLAGFSNTCSSAIIYEGWTDMLKHQRGSLTGALMGAAESLHLDRLIANPNLYVQQTIKTIEMGHATVGKHNRLVNDDYEKLDKEILKAAGIGKIHGPIDFRKVYDFCLDFKDIDDGHGNSTVKGSIISQYDYEKYNEALEEARKSGKLSEFNRTSRKFKDGMTVSQAYETIKDKCFAEIKAISERAAIMERTVDPISTAEEESIDVQERPIASDTERQRVEKLLQPDDRYGLHIFSPEYDSNETKTVAYIKKMAHNLLEELYTPSDEYMTEKYKKLMELPEDHVHRRFYDRIRRTQERYDAYVPDNKKLGGNLPVGWADSKHGVGFFAKEGRLRGWFSNNMLHDHYVKDIAKTNKDKGKVSNINTERNRDSSEIMVPLSMSGYVVNPDMQSYDLASLFAKTECSLNNYMVMNPLMAQFKVMNHLWEDTNRVGEQMLGGNMVGLSQKDLDNMRDAVRHVIEGSHTDTSSPWTWAFHKVIRPMAATMCIGFKPISQLRSHYASLSSIFSKYPQYFKPKSYITGFVDANLCGAPGMLLDTAKGIFGAETPKRADLREFFGFNDAEALRTLPHFHGLEKSAQAYLYDGILNAGYCGYSWSDAILQSDVCSGIAHSSDCYNAEGKHIGSLYDNIKLDKDTGKYKLNTDVAKMTYAEGTDVIIDGKKNTHDSLVQSLQHTAKMIMSNTTNPASSFYMPMWATKSAVGRSTMMVKKIPINEMTASMEQWRYDLSQQVEQIGFWEALTNKKAPALEKTKAMLRGVIGVGHCFRAIETLFDKNDRLPAREKMPEVIRQQLEGFGLRMTMFMGACYLAWTLDAKSMLRKGYVWGKEYHTFGDKNAANTKLKANEEAIKKEEFNQKINNPMSSILDYFKIADYPHTLIQDYGTSGTMFKHPSEYFSKLQNKYSHAGFMNMLKGFLVNCAMDGYFTSTNPIEGAETSISTYKLTTSDVVQGMAGQAEEKAEKAIFGYKNPKSTYDMKDKKHMGSNRYMGWHKGVEWLYKHAPTGLFDNIKDQEYHPSPYEINFNY